MTTTFRDVITNNTHTITVPVLVVDAGMTCPQDCDGAPDTSDAYETSDLIVGHWYWIEDDGEWYVSEAVVGVFGSAV